MLSVIGVVLCFFAGDSIALLGWFLGAFVEIPLEIFLYKRLSSGTKKVVSTVKDYKETKDLENQVRKEYLKAQLKELQKHNEE